MGDARTTHLIPARILGEIFHLEQYVRRRITTMP